jgi:leukotriene-A4 hydrolase
MRNYLLYFCGLLLVGCQSNETKKLFYHYDPHSAARPNDARAVHLDWEAEVNFEHRHLTATARWLLEKKNGVTEVIFDTDGLEILEVTLDGGIQTSWHLGEPQPYVGSALVIKISAENSVVNIRYRTGPGAKAMQWLEAEQTKGKRYPFLFTQGQAVLSRSLLPCQDSPGLRFSFDAKVQVPAGLMAVMSAQNPKTLQPSGRYRFSNIRPIPAYLFSLAVGDFHYKAYDQRSGVYAENEMLATAWQEFAELPAMIRAAEQLFGVYPWERYDVLVLPPSFPFGGMENPMVMFATPTIIAGDRSLTNLIAHELSHSWSGNLVTNATWNDFWINEGFTTYIERRILEAIHGSSYVEMISVLGKIDLEKNIASGQIPMELTRLKMSLEGKNPDDALNAVPYQKGYALLHHIEKAVGRERMDAFIKANFEAHAFQSMTTEGFLEFLESHLLDAAAMDRLQIKAWVYDTGLPESFEAGSSKRFNVVEAELEALLSGKPVNQLNTAGWSSYEWLYFLRQLRNQTYEISLLEKLDQAFGFSESGNSELQVEWFLCCIPLAYPNAKAAMERFLSEIGRRKLVVPVYRALWQHLPSRPLALQWFIQYADNYHPITRNSVAAVLSD